MAKKHSKRHLTVAGLIAALLLGLGAWFATGRIPLVSSEASTPDHRRPPPPAGAFAGEVVGVIDGDTIDVMHEGEAVRVRLAEIDCPEKKQPFGTKAKQRTSELAFKKTVRVETTTVDRYNRAVAKVVLPDGRSLNETLLEDGLAWWYGKYSKDEHLGEMEKAARGAKRGLWSDESPVPPWIYRRRSFNKGLFRTKAAPENAEPRR